MLEYNIIVDKFNNFETYKSQFSILFDKISSDNSHAKILTALPLLEKNLQLGLDQFGGSIKLKERQNNMDGIVAHFTSLKDVNPLTPSDGSDTSQNNNSNATNSFLFFFFVIFILLFVVLILYFIFQNFANTK
ncbi:MAG: hypothetical protein ACQBVK_01905 [Candidatus Phytoplasma sp. TWB_XP]